MSHNFSKKYVDFFSEDIVKETSASNIVDGNFRSGNCMDHIFDKNAKCIFFRVDTNLHTKNHQIEHYPRRASSREENLIAPIQIYMYTKNHQIEDYPRRASSREENLIAPTGAF